MRAVERTKAFIRETFPAGVFVYRRLREARRALHERVAGAGLVFSDIYRKNLWADPESVSGRGSTLARTEAIRRALPGLLAGVGARSLLDAPCGDFNWMRHVELGGVEYTGADVVPELIARNREAHGGPGRTFIVADVTRDRLPKVDVILCRDCFIHLSFRDINAALANFKRSGSRFLLATTHAGVAENEDIRTGGWRSVNLQSPPFNLPQPRQLLVEDAGLGKCLGLWSLEELEARRAGVASVLGRAWPG
ncbi:MAG TPA: class I SAM-dependent methyltransferase [Pyrinomonadaceae bacterium]|nr:class I SAM-dependent methyltransferase [Pyrinomonadaceae bacterium]